MAVWAWQPRKINEKRPAEKLRGVGCGETEIRTRDTLLAYTRFPGVPLKPLEHLSKRTFQIFGTAKISVFLLLAKKS